MLARLSMQFAVPVLGMLIATGSTFAQSTDGGYGSREVNRFRNQTVRNYSIDSINRGDIRRNQARAMSGSVQTSITRSSSDLGIAPRSAPKPFTTVSPTPTVSPYLNLFREDLGGNDDLNYQTLVRPQLDQLRTNEVLQRQNQELARRMQSISAQRDYNPTGAQNVYPTGHPTVFNHLGRYYPAAAARRR